MPEQVLAQPALYTAEARRSSTADAARSAATYSFRRKLTDANLAARSATNSKPVSLAGAGKLHSFATVHLHQDRSGKGLQAPFTVGLIVLDDGPAVRSILTERDR